MVKVRWYAGDNAGSLGIDTEYETVEEADNAIQRAAEMFGWLGIRL